MSSVIIYHTILNIHEHGMFQLAMSLILYWNLENKGRGLTSQSGSVKVKNNVQHKVLPNLYLST